VEAICTAAKKDAPALQELQTKVEETVKQEGTQAKGAISELKEQVIEKLETLQSSLVTALSRLTLNPPVKKAKKPMKRSYNEVVLVRPPPRKLPSMPCSCLLSQGGRMTRIQRIEAFMRGEVKCRCRGRPRHP
jgi:ElaB/YqjD/DUF883 family membrane-anchored ribosome-binding protein